MIQYLNRNLNENQKPIAFNASTTTNSKNYTNKYATYGQQQTNEYRNENVFILFLNRLLMNFICFLFKK